MLRRPALSSRAGAVSIWYRSVRCAASTTKGRTSATTAQKRSAATAQPRTSPYPPPLIKIDEATFFKTYPSSAGDDPTNPPLLKDINFTLGARRAEWPKTLSSTELGNRESQRPTDEEMEIRKKHGPFHWAVIGPGSTTFLNILQGQYIAVPPKSRSYPYLSSEQFVPKDPKLRHPSNAIQYVGFSGEGSQATGGTRGAYLSARYESLREETDWTVLQYLKGQTELNPLEGQESAHLYDEDFFQEVAQNLRLKDLLDMPVSNLSNGQTRRTRIAKALLAKPELLLLDEPFMGLDPATTDSISSLLRNLADHSSPRVLLSLRPQDPIPEWITNVLVLADNSILYSGSKETFLASTQKPQRQVRSSENDPSQPSESLNQHLNQLSLTQRTPISFNGEPILEMDGVHVQYGDKVVLGDWKQEVLGQENSKQGLQWRVRRGQRWAVLGANGSGKTTLLSVITSDHPQAYALPVRTFGRARLPEPGKPAISIFDLQARIGHSSPEIHAFFPRQLSLRASIESAWADTFLAKPTLSYEIDTLVDRVLEYFKPEFDPNPKVLNDADLSFIPEGFRKKILPENSRSNTKSRKQPPQPPTFPLDHSIQYAESLTFGQLTIAQQRLVLFIRAIIKKQDLIILDEAFSGMPASMREKCFALLNNTGPSEPETAREESEKEKEQKPPRSQLPYLGPEQSLLVVSHLREEIPDTVRFWMRLPSEVGDGQKLQFALGVVPDGTTLSSDQDAWDTIWSQNSLARAQIDSVTGTVEDGKEASTPNDAEKYGYVVPRVVK